MGRRANKPIVMWAVFYGSGCIDHDSVRRTRRQAIDAFLTPYGPTWDIWRNKHGCRPIKVLVSPRPTDEAGNG